MYTFVKFSILFLIMMVLKWIFSIAYHFFVQNICETHSEETANETYFFLKCISWVLVFIYFCIILIWQYVGFADMSLFHKIITASLFLYLLGYCRSSMGMLTHLIYLIYTPHLLSERTYDGFAGEVKYEDDKLLFIHEGSKTNINLSDRV